MQTQSSRSWLACLTSLKIHLMLSQGSSCVWAFTLSSLNNLAMIPEFEGLHVISVATIPIVNKCILKRRKNIQNVKNEKSIFCLARELYPLCCLQQSRGHKVNSYSIHHCHPWLVESQTNLEADIPSSRLHKPIASQCKRKMALNTLPCTAAEQPGNKPKNCFSKESFAWVLEKARSSF